MRYLCFLFILALGGLGFSQNPLFTWTYKINLMLSNEESAHYIDNGITFETYLSSDVSSFASYHIKESDILQEPDGYEYLLLGDQKRIIILGNEFLQIKPITPGPDKILYENIIRNHASSENFFDIFEGRLIKRIEYSGKSLIENIGGKQVNYDPNNLRNRIFRRTEQIFADAQWNYDAIPWVEGMPGNGVESYFVISFGQSVDAIYILNGYVDLQNRKLFKENNRLKSIKIENAEPAQYSQRWEIDYVFDDVVKFSRIELPAYSKEIKITIKSVYAGSKYNDTAVSAVLPPIFEYKPTK